MALRPWIKDGKAVVDAEGRLILCKECPCIPCTCLRTLYLTFAGLGGDFAAFNGENVALPAGGIAAFPDDFAAPAAHGSANRLCRWTSEGDNCLPSCDLDGYMVTIEYLIAHPAAVLVSVNLYSQAGGSPCVLSFQALKSYIPTMPLFPLTDIPVVGCADTACADESSCATSANALVSITCLGYNCTITVDRCHYVGYPPPICQLAVCFTYSGTVAWEWNGDQTYHAIMSGQSSDDQMPKARVDFGPLSCRRYDSGAGVMKMEWRFTVTVFSGLSDTSQLYVFHPLHIDDYPDGTYTPVLPPPCPPATCPTNEDCTNWPSSLSVY